MAITTPTAIDQKSTDAPELNNHHFFHLNYRLEKLSPLPSKTLLLKAIKSITKHNT